MTRSMLTLGSFRVVGLLAFVCTHTAVADIKNCVDQTMITEIQEELLRGSFLDNPQGQVRRYPKTVSPEQNPNSHLMNGFESEYTLAQSERLLKFYHPKPGSSITREQWNAMNHEQRTAWIRTDVKSQARDGHGFTETSLVRGDVPEELSFLPERLIYDDTGNLEIVLKPVDTLEEWTAREALIAERLGAGSMQGTVSLPTEALFSSSGKEDLNAALGFLNFMNEVDVAQKLVAGFKNYQADPTREVARTFKHPWLGPMTRAKQLRLIQLLDAGDAGQQLSAAQIERIRAYASSPKYVGSTAYRPDIVAPTRIIFEARDSHTNSKLLSSRMTRLTWYLVSGWERFKIWSEVPAFDSSTDFQKFPETTQTKLKEWFPSLAESDFTLENQLAVEIYRNFAWPLRDWAPFADVLKASPTFKRTIENAKTQYLTEVNHTASEVTAGRLSKEKAIIEVQASLAKFAEKSGVAEMLERWEIRNLTENKAYNKYLELTQRGRAPLADAFPKGKAWSGTLTDRSKRFVEKWKDNAFFVDDVRFNLAGSFPMSGSRKVLVISLEGLTSEKIAAIHEDYLAMMSRGTVSFPLGHRAGHLYSRIGTKSYSSMGAPRGSDYRFQTLWGDATHEGARLEPVVELSPVEELRLRFFVEFAQNNSAKALGGFSMSGPPAGETNRRLRDTRSVVPGEGHSCTSWICMAPIGGKADKFLYELVGARPGLDIYSNPGWWSAYLHTRAKADRIPFTVYITYESVDQARIQVKSGQELKWDWNPH
jgi:hypothetical protein